jgi:glutathione S-transferase
MPSYKLTYFDIDGGRAEPIRIGLHAAGIEFEDHRISFQEFGEQRGDLRFRAVPVLEIDGVQVTQSNALSRYVGRMAGLYPADALQALYCDEVMGAMEDLTHYVVQTFGLEGEALAEARKQLTEGRITVFLNGTAELLERGGGNYFADGQLTMADLKAFVQVRSLASGRLEHVPGDIVQSLAPTLMEHQQRISEDPRVVAYYQSRTQS